MFRTPADDSTLQNKGLYKQTYVVNCFLKDVETFKEWTKRIAFGSHFL